MRVVGAADGRLDAGDALEFYGQRNTLTFTDSPQTRYSDTNVYWLVNGTTAGPRIPELDATPTTSQQPCHTTPSAVREERQTYIRRGSFASEGRDHWFTERLIG